MAREVVVVGDLPYTVNFDDPRRRGDLFQSLVLAQLSDELTGNPVAAPVEVTTNLAGAADAHGSQRRRGARRHPGTRLPASRRPAVSLRRAFRGRRIPPTRADAGDRGATADVPRHVRRREPRSRRAPAPTRLVHCAGARAGSPEPTPSGRECDHRSLTVVATRRRSRQCADRRRHRRAPPRALRAAPAARDDVRARDAQSARRTRSALDERRAGRVASDRGQQRRRARPRRMSSGSIGPTPTEPSTSSSTASSGPATRTRPPRSCSPIRRSSRTARTRSCAP